MGVRILACLVGLTIPQAVRAFGAHPMQTPAPAQSRQYAISFKDQLRHDSDITLSADSSHAAVRFFCESGTRPARGSELHLFIEHSPDLDGNRSFLSVSLNYGILRSLRLDSESEKPTEVIVALPPDLLKLENELLFSAELFPAGKGSRTGLRMTIDNQSYILIRSAPNHPDLDLSALPSPMLDPYSYRPKRLAALVPERISPQTMEAMALLTANLSAWISGEPVEIELVKTVAAAGDPLLIVGTPSEQPLLKELQSSVSFVISGGGGQAALRLSNGETPGRSEGLAGLATRSPADPLPVLIVTGNSPAGVLTAARNLLDPDLHLSGRLARVFPGWNRAAGRPREWRGFIPPVHRFKLGLLGYKDLRLGPQNQFALAVPLRAPPDARFLRYGHEMKLFLRLSPDLSDPDGEITLLWNNTLLLKSVVREIARGSLASISTRIPADLLRSNNELKILWRGSVQGTSPGAAAWLLPESEFYLPRNYSVELPDLELLQFHLYPLSLKPDLSDTILLIPNQPSLTLLPLIIELSAILGRMAPAAHLAFNVRRLSDLGPGERDQFHFVALNIDGTEDSAERTFPGWNLLPRPRAMRGVPSLREGVSPWNPDKYVLSISAGSVPALLRTVRQVFKEETLKQLRGDAALLGSDIVSLRIARKRRVREWSVLAQVEAWLRANWLALPIILTSVSGLLFIALRLSLHHYRKGR